VTCCFTMTNGTKCRREADAAHCTAKQGTVGMCTSCCDACPAPGSGQSCPTTTTTTTTTTIPSSCDSSCSVPCNSACHSSICADSSGTCGFQHLGSGAVCAGSCAGSSCASDSDCGSGKVCVVPFLGCCSPCTFTCDSSPAPTCGGTCASGQVCGQVSGGNSC